MANNIQAYMAEAIATFALVFFGAGAILAGADLVGVALAHGIAIMVMVYATAHISGAHINPAVTIGMLITKQINSAKAIGYIIFQLIGAAVAGMALKTIYGSVPAAAQLGTPALATTISPLMGIIIEAILTFFLVFVIFGVAVDKRAPAGSAGLAIGLVITMDILMGGVLTGGAMNPARSFGPAFASGFWTNHLVYWIGPILGAIGAAVIYNGFLLEKKKTRRK